MGITASDVITSAPSAWGAANAAAAATFNPWAAAVAVPLAALVSDPAQMWHAGSRYGTVADHLRSAGAEIGAIVTRRADADHWSERGKDAFMHNRVAPYQATLEQAAGLYDRMDHTLKWCAAGYTEVGLLAAALGSATLAVAANFPVASEAELTMAGAVARTMLGGLAKLNGTGAAFIRELATGLGAVKTAGVLTAGGAGLALSWHEGVAGFARTRADLRWPKLLPGGARPPGGYQAPRAADGDAIRRIDPASITALGKELETNVGGVLESAYDLACGNDVGYPGFGVVGVGLAHAHAEMRERAAAQLAECRDTPGRWLPGLMTTAGNWVYAAQASTDAVTRVTDR